MSDTGSKSQPLRPPPRGDVQQLSATGQRWQDLTAATFKSHATAVTSHYLRPHPSGKPGNFNIGWMTSFHAHGNFGHAFNEQSGPNPNISTQGEDQGAFKHDKLINASGPNWAQNTMRVVKGTSSLNKTLEGTESQAQGAVLLGHEIGISEVGRGGEGALLNAMSAMYLAKHGRMTADQFLDPKVGFAGAGKGGAERLRQIDTLDKAFHLDSLRTHFDEVASQKPKWQDKSFDDWITHKRSKWVQKY
ncbi:hypothetical protein [Gynuella sp.]|uniref:hypothetical protein n=1 Tax=Gynuella sp. TaxID=2969146 RepID=UPI003D101215